MRRSPLATIGILGSLSLALLVPTAAMAAPTQAPVPPPSGNTAPVAIDQSLPVAQNTSVDFVLAATDPDGDALTFTTNTPGRGTLSGVAPNLTYTPAAGYSGPDVFVFRTSDGVNASVVATVYVSVYVPPNHPPVAYSQSISTRTDRSVPVTVRAIDADADALRFSLLTWSYCHCSAQHGTVTGSDGNYVYTPRPGYTGPDWFEFRAMDTGGAASVARVDITVTSSARVVRSWWR
ncbi:hypothetical protein B0I08_10619 [Glaciihabitans tibetensis]|uniref:Tandem-95 repeat protein n=1 Tax=Glaciihabitans tibetensis TaxID=1266600 RepID=A0A2T0VB42_9MICO|nr:Ig-like domain-containing protein [Glaciihabitans tibetensis]PRY67416.1 hypothetical protein B0I08_10619 [Glaciihabitans tibetensis]